MKRFFIQSFVLIFVVLAPFFVSAATSVSSFIVSPSSAISGESVAFIWTLTDAGGYSFNIPCVSGVKINYASGGTYPCTTTISSTAATNDSKDFIFYNASGGTRSVTAQLIPKDGTGANVTSAARDVSVSVAALANPITSFTASKTETSPGEAITISWTAPYLDGVNLKIECKNEIKVSSPSYTTSGFLPCGAIVFSPDLSPSSSLTLSFSNSSPSALSYKLTLLPAISAGSYDATHAKYLDLTVASDVIPDPLVKSFTSSTTSTYSGEEIKFSWQVSNAVGTNLQISCVTSLTASSSKSPGEVLPCGKPAFSPDLATSSSVTLRFDHKEVGSQNVKVTLLPVKKQGVYDAPLGKEITITVKPQKIETILPLPPALTSTPTLTPTPLPAPAPKLAPSPAPAPIGGSAPAPKTSPSPAPAPKPASPVAPQELIEVPPPSSGGGFAEQLEELLKSLRQASEEFKARSLSLEKVESVSKELVSQGIIDQVDSYRPVILGGESKTNKHEFTGIKQSKLFYFIPVTLRIRVEVDNSGAIQKINKPWWSFALF